MAVSAFKSSSKRGNLLTSSTKTSSDKESKENLPKKVPPRRSRSVSAFSRTPTQSDASSDFLVKRDNPLFWSNNSPPDNEIVAQNEITISKFDEVTPKIEATKSADNRRGRSVLRNADVGRNVSGIGRSLSRVDTGRRGRSVSRCPVSRGGLLNSESEVEQEGSLSAKNRNRNSLNVLSNNGKKSNPVRSSSDILEQIKSPRTWPCETSDGSATNLLCSRTLNWEDGASTGSFSEAEEKTIKAVCEQMKSSQVDNLRGDNATSGIYETVRSEVRRAISDIQNDLESAIRRTNATAIASTSVTDIPPDLVNPGAVELVLDIRREYATKLEESQERARKLRADLAVEEHRGLELSRILKELLPDPKTPNVHKSRKGRKASIERRKMSKRLTEEAMAYFDECISLSTFDSSDFSSQEDPPINLAGVANPVGDGVQLPQASSSVSAIYCPSSSLNDKQECRFTHDLDTLELTASSSSKEPTLDQVSVNSTVRERGRKFQFSFSDKPSETFELQQDIRKYVRSFKKDIEKVSIDSQTVRSNRYDLDEYNLQTSQQSLLFDRVFFKNRLESGGLLLCGGGISISFSPLLL